MSYHDRPRFWPAGVPARAPSTIRSKTKLFQEREERLLESIRNMWRWRSYSSAHNNSTLRAFIRQDLNALRSIRSARAAYFEGTLA